MSPGGVSTVLTLTFLFMYALPSENGMGLKVFFGIWLVGFYTFFPGIYASMAPVTQATFGHLNYSRDYGLLFTQSMFGSVVLIITTKFLKESIGYYGLFSICGGIGIIGNSVRPRYFEIFQYSRLFQDCLPHGNLKKNPNLKILAV